jgi:hypothetical protein
MKLQRTMDRKSKYNEQFGTNNAYESLFQTLTQKSWFAGGFAWKWYADEYHKQKKNNVDYTPQDKPALETIKKWYK